MDSIHGSNPFGQGSNPWFPATVDSCSNFKASEWGSDQLKESSLCLSTPIGREKRLKPVIVSVRIRGEVRARVAEWNMLLAQNQRNFVGSTPTPGTYLSFQKVFQQVSLWKASRYG